MADRQGKHRVSAKQKTSHLFRFWHNIQDLKLEAEEIADRELVLLVGMVELLVEERITDLRGGQGTRLRAAEVSHAH